MAWANSLWPEQWDSEGLSRPSLLFSTTLVWPGFSLGVLVASTGLTGRLEVLYGSAPRRLGQKPLLFLFTFLFFLFVSSQDTTACP